MLRPRSALTGVLILAVLAAPVSTALAAPPVAVRVPATGGPFASSVSVANLSPQADTWQPLTSLKTSGRLGADEAAIYLLWLADREVVDFKLTGTGDIDIALFREEGTLLGSSTGPGSTESIYGPADIPDGWDVCALVVYANTAGSYLLKTALSDAAFTASLSRVAGPTRYDTAIEIAEDAFPAGCDTVVIASGVGFADALSASGLCGACDAPLLLVPPGSLPAAVSAEIDDLGATRAFIVGGTKAVGASVEAALNNKPSLEGSVTRVAGRTRYETAAMIAGRMSSELGTDLPTAFVASGQTYPDALATSPLAYAARIPILLTDKAYAPQETLDALGDVGVERAIIVGGPAVVGLAAQDDVEAVVGGPSERWAGGTRWETATEVAAHGEIEGWVSLDHVGVVSGRTFADALGGGVAAGAAGGVLVLTEPYVLSEAAEIFLADANGSASTGRVYGGPAAVWGNTYGMIDETLFLP